VLRMAVFGKESVVLVTRNHTYTSGEGWHDGPAGDVATSLTARGYAMDDAGLKSVAAIMVETEEHGTAGVTVQAAFNGQRTTQTLVTPRTRRPAKYIQHGRQDRDLTNPDDNAQEPLREDYSIAVADNTVIGSGLQLDVFQSHTLRGVCTGRVRWVQPVISSTRGRLRIKAIRAQGAPLPE